jgi:hypothetical protein
MIKAITWLQQNWNKIDIIGKVMWVFLFPVFITILAIVLANRKDLREEMVTPAEAVKRCRHIKKLTS